MEVLYAGGGQLVCCGENMEFLEEKIDDVGEEKHVPVVKKDKYRVRVTVGAVLHPMQEDHYIEWIELVSKDRTYHKFLKPGDTPEAEFFGVDSEQLTVRIYCNVHGLWKKE